MSNEDINLKSSESDSVSLEEKIKINLEKNKVIENNEIKLFYGNNFGIREPKKIGNIYAFLYTKNGWPLITIGPDCIIILLIYS